MNRIIEGVAVAAIVALAATALNLYKEVENLKSWKKHATEVMGSNFNNLVLDNSKIYLTSMHSKNGCMGFIDSGHVVLEDCSNHKAWQLNMSASPNN